MMEEIEIKNKEEEVRVINKENPYLIPASIIVAGVLIAGAVFYSNRGGFAVAVNPGLKANSPANNQAVVPGDLADDDPVLGDPNAPITLVEFSDFQCPFCRMFWRNTLPEIKEQYIKTGKAKLIYRDFPLTNIHPGAEPAALAGECADEQGKFWAFHDKIYEEQDKQGEGTIQFGSAELKKWAREIGINGASFDNCLDSKKYADEVAKDLEAGQAAGIGGTPATFVNGQLVSGALPFAQFKPIIEAALKK